MLHWTLQAIFITKARCLKVITYLYYVHCLITILKLFYFYIFEFIEAKTNTRCTFVIGQINLNLNSVKTTQKISVLYNLKRRKNSITIKNEKSAAFFFFLLSFDVVFAWLQIKDTKLHCRRQTDKVAAINFTNMRQDGRRKTNLPISDFEFLF